MSAAESSTGQLAAATVEEVMESAAKLSEALHTDFRARDVLRATTIASAAAEARWTVEALAACTGKNAEQRKAEFDLALLDARSPGGVLFATYTEGLDAQRHAWRRWYRPRHRQSGIQCCQERRGRHRRHALRRRVAARGLRRCGGGGAGQNSPPNRRTP